MRLRPLRPDDYDAVIRVLDAWFGGGRMVPMLPRLFFTHFHPGSVAAEDADGRLVGFLVGFRSPAQPDEAYVHFIGVAPEARGDGVGRALHAAFAEEARAAGCRRVRCVTGPSNRASIAFHTRLGFRVDAGDATSDGVAYTRDYDGPGEDRVRFVRDL